MSDNTGKKVFSSFLHEKDGIGYGENTFQECERQPYRFSASRNVQYSPAFTTRTPT